MTPQQHTVQAIVKAIRSHPKGVSVDELLREVLKMTETKNIPFYLGAERSFGSFLHDLEDMNLLKLTSQRGTILVRPTQQMTSEIEFQHF